MKLRISIVLLFILSLYAWGFAQETPDGRRAWKQDVRYVIEAELDTAARRLNGDLSIFYKNNSPDTLHQIYLQVPSNAFHDEENTAVREMRRFANTNVDFEQVRGHKVTIQSLQFLSIGDETEFPLQAYDFSDTILELTLPYSLPPGDTLSLGVFFFQEFDSRGKRAIPSEHVLWFPRLAVYDKDGWYVEPFHFMMESFDVYSEFAEFDVTLTVPGNYVVIGGGKLVSGDPGWKAVQVDTSLNEDDYTVWQDSMRTEIEQAALSEGPRRVRFVAGQLQNFSWSASPKFVYFPYEADVPIHIFSRGDNFKRWLTELLDRLDGVLDFHRQYFGRYPFDHLNLVRSWNDGMAEPMLARIGDNSEFSLSYELSSIYFPGIVGSNGVEESWLAKGLQVYMGKVYSEHVFGDLGYNKGEAQEDMNWFERQYPLPSLNQLVRNFTHLYRDSGQDEQISKPIYGYKDPFGTFFNVYLKSDIFYEMLHYVVGDSSFKAATRELVDRYAFKHIRERELLDTFQKASKQDLDWFFEQWLRGTPTVDYSKGKIEKRKVNDSTWVTEVEVKRNGDGIMPVDVEVEMSDGQKMVKRWEGKEKEGKVVFETIEKPKGVKLDPNDQVMDNNRLNNQPPRIEVRPDWPFLKYFYMPNDAILVLWSPLLHYNSVDKLRLGIKTRSSYRAFFNNVTLDASVGLASGEVDVTAGYNHPLRRSNLLNRYYLMVRKIEGRFEADAHVQFKGSDGILTSSGRSLELGLNYSSLLNGNYTLRDVANDTGEVVIQEWDDVDILMAYAEGRLSRALGKTVTAGGRLRLETALPGGDRQFTKVSTRLQFDLQTGNFKGLLRANYATSFGPDPLPAQDSFRADGAAPRERLRNDVMVTGSAFFGFARRYVEGQGYLRGYSGLPLPVERYATANLEIGLARPLLVLRPYLFFDTGRVWEDSDARFDTRSDAGFGLSLFGDGFNLFGGNLSLFSELSAKLIFPIWLSDPIPGTKATRLRWYISLGKAL